MPKPVRSIDRRVAKTRLALRGGLLELLAIKSWDDVSIQEICGRANVGRSTFYIHYQSKEGLLAESMNDLRQYLVASTPSSRYSSSRSEFRLLHGLVDHIAEQRAVLTALIGRRGGQPVIARFKELTRQLIEIELSQRGYVIKKNHWLPHYLAGGIVEVMSWWVETAKSFSVDELKHKLDLLVAKALTVN